MRGVLPILTSCVLASTWLGAATTTRSQLVIAEMPSPARAESSGPNLTLAPDGTARMTWVERTSGGPTLRIAAFDPTNRRWTRVQTIAAGPSVGTSSSDLAQLAQDGSGRLHAVWTDGRGAAHHSESSAAGDAWTAPTPWSVSGDVENFSLTALADGRVLAVWLDGRTSKNTPRFQQLYSRIVGQPAETDRLIDDSVCDCCETTLAPLLDGGALVAYRDRTPDEIRDISVSRLSGEAWREARVVVPDGWRIPACPVNGPRISVNGSGAAVAWFTGADGDARVQVTYSPDAGGRWLMPLRIDGGRPVGRVDCVLLRDQSVLVTWLEADGSLWLRRITPDFAATTPTELAPKGTVALQSAPRIILTKDYAGDLSNAELLIAYTAGSTSAGVRTLLVTVPEGELLIAERKCNCAPAADELRGIPIRGTVVRVDAQANRVQLRHDELPGVFDAGVHAFLIEPLALPDIRPGRSVLARVERTKDGWRIFNIRTLGAP